MKKNQTGFGIVELIMLLVIAGLIGFIGYYVWHTKSNTDKNLNTAATTSSATASKSAVAAADPYSSWKQYCSPIEKACFKYPSGWTIDTSQSSTDQDNALLTSPDGVSAGFQSPVAGLGGACDPNTSPHVFIHKVIPITNKAGLNIVEYGDKTTTADAGITDKSPSTGDTGDCLYYATFNSSMFTANNRQSGTNTIPAGDLATLELIFKSYSNSN